MPRDSQEIINNLYLVLSTEVLYYVEPILDYGIGPEIPYGIAELVIAKSPGQAKWLAYKNDEEGYAYTQDVRDMPKFSVKLKKKNIKREKGIVSGEKIYQKYWD